MKLVLKNTGSNANFVSWLKSYKDIYPALLLEIDINEFAFVAKNFTAEKSIVKYSKISFEDAGYEMSQIIDNTGNSIEWKSSYDTSTDGRVKCGISNCVTLPEFISVVGAFTNTDHDLTFDFYLNKSVVYKGLTTTDCEYQVNNVIFQSKTLTMNVGCSQITDIFFKCNDDTFLNKVCYIGSPSSFNISIDALNNLSKISSFLNSDDKNNNEIKFYSKEFDGHHALYAYDETKKTYDYLLGYFSDGDTSNTAIQIYKDHFMKAIKGINADNMIITLDTAGASKLLMETNDSKIIIGAVKC